MLVDGVEGAVDVVGLFVLVEGFAVVVLCVLVVVNLTVVVKGLKVDVANRVVVKGSWNASGVFAVVVNLVVDGTCMVD